MLQVSWLERGGPAPPLLPKVVTFQRVSGKPLMENAIIPEQNKLIK